MTRSCTKGEPVYIEDLGVTGVSRQIDRFLWTCAKNGGSLGTIERGRYLTAIDLECQVVGRCPTLDDARDLIVRIDTRIRDARRRATSQMLGSVVQSTLGSAP